MKREKRKVPFEVVRPHLRRAAGQQMGLRMRWGGGVFRKTETAFAH